MRLAILATGLVVGVLAVVILGNSVFRPPPADERLEGVDVAVAGYTIEDLVDDRHRLALTVSVTSAHDLDECLAFALDQPFRHRRIETADGACLRPTAGQQTASLVYVGLTDDDLIFPSHSLGVGCPRWSLRVHPRDHGRVRGRLRRDGRLRFAVASVFPSIEPFGSFGPLIPLFSFEPP